MALTFIGVMNSTNGSCPWLKQPIPCDFALYDSNQSLAETQKLLPNTDVTGSNILVMFIAVTFAACALSVLLLVDQICLLSGCWDHESYKKLFYSRLRHTIDTTLHTLSDSQIITGLALLVVTSFHASCISAYHYNVVCYLMAMSIMTHALVFVNVPEFCAKNAWVGAGRILGILCSFALTWELFKARDVANNFPVAADSSLIMPASCFVGNQTSVLDSSFISGGSSNGTLNQTMEILLPSGSGDGSYQYGHTFLPVAVFFLVGLVFLFVDSVQHLRIRADRHQHSYQYMFWTLIIRSAITIAITVLVIYATVNYYQLKDGFEIDEWYVKTLEDTASVGQILVLMMSTTSLFAVIKIFGEAIEGPRGASDVDKVLAAIKEAGNIPDRIDTAEQCAAIASQDENALRSKLEV